MLGAALAGSKKAAPKGLSNDECLACHSDPTVFKEVDGKKVSLAVDGDKFKNSAHSIFSCTDCHTDVKTAPHETTPARVQCATCHGDEVAAYQRSFHAKAIKAGDTQAASCIDCHGSPHELQAATEPTSRVNHANIPKTCGSCHGQKFVMEKSGHSAQPFNLYQESVHGKDVAANGAQSKAAVCTDCHGTHEILSANDSKSSIFKFNVPTTCAKCHENVKQEYTASIHGQAVARGNWQAPVCTDCHGIHSIKAPTDPNSSVAATALAQTTCARCHESTRLSSEFGLESHRASTYLASYHGLASRMGSKVVANCASCHGVHNILPSSDPRSTINRANLATTCGHCHPGANDKFIMGKVHVDAPLSADVGSMAVRWIRRFYLSLIFGVIGFMLVHNLIIWRRKARERREAHRRLVVRMDPAQRAQHLTLLISFFTLVLTGFALKYPDSWFASLFGNETVRSVIHRIAGVVLIAVSLFHAIYLASNREGRRMFMGMLPVEKDAWDILGTLRYYLGMAPKKPEFGRFTYAEKMEYWALVWGMFVMAGTGLALWFKVQVGDLLPRWTLDAFTAIHFYEAVLATLAILVWHFYQVFFDPDVYPMNWAWFDGRVSVEHYQEEHALDADTILQSVQKAAEENAAGEEGAAASESGKSEESEQEPAGSARS